MDEETFHDYSRRDTMKIVIPSFRVGGWVLGGGGEDNCTFTKTKSLWQLL